MRIRPALILALSLAVAFTHAASAQQSREPVSDPWGSDPAATQRAGAGTVTNNAIAISQVRFPDDSASHVVLSRDDVFADALAGTPLLGEGPLLLADRDTSFRISQTLEPSVRAELDRVLPDGGRVYILGGTGALGRNLEDELRADGYDVKRLSGPDRFKTAQVIAQEVSTLYPGSANTVLIARGYGTDTNPTAAWADSVTAGGFAANSRTPVVLSTTPGLSPEAAEFLQGRDAAILLGGRSALSDQVAADAAGIVARVDRASGASRDGTAVKIMTNLWRAPAGTGRILVINGYQDFGWAFGLPAAGLAADFDAPMLPVATTILPDQTAAAVSSCHDKQVQTLVVGTAAVIDDAVVAAIEARDGNPCIPNVDTTRVVADAPGRDDETGAGEYVELTNRESTTVAVGGWTLHDDDGNTGTICSGLTITPGGTVRIYSNDGTSTSTTCFMNAGTYLNNDGDTVILRTDRGDEVDRITYAGGGT